MLSYLTDLCYSNYKNQNKRLFIKKNAIAVYIKFFIWFQKLPQINREFAAKLKEQEKEESKRGIKKVSKFNW